MSKNINVKLTFSADTKAAQQQINQLQQTLSNIAATPISGSGLKATAQEIQVATNKALELKVALNNATNVNTGKLNFNKFSQELKRNKTTLQEYSMQLQKLGPQGVQAFSQMATAIRQSETPLVAMQGKLAALGQTFMNTVKWSISSSMIQGVTRAFSSTIDYAKELNESLNNIRIVTGKSVADVSKFAVEANKAAKALSATTDEYAKASLIYFQQGLNDSAVAERTETTLKLAKVVGESAETTSEWMTAIWNNFDDGSRSLENYADVLAKLGAATASSADEIAGGLEKFAAVAETVGLSYEYAASALATITAETRQSEDVVGTALKTIFARVENLKLGETLEDGTTLGQYSEALAKVGVNIKDSNGQLKEMDDILSSIGTTWQILDRDQQVALAQQVAGIRQYSQFMALMDNWDVMEENVEMAKEANGALEEQHEIWETGIEGATSRVKEELNEIKNNLLGENDLLPLLNIAEGFLDFVGDLVDSLGGLPGLLSIIASVGLKLWGPQAAAGLTSMINGVKSLYGVASGSAQADRSAMIKESAGLSAQMFTDSGMGNEEAATASKFSKDNAARVIETEEAQGTLNSVYKETLHLLEQIIQKRQEEAQLAAQNVDKAIDDLGVQKDSLANKYGEEKVDWDKDAQKPIKRIKIGDVSASQMNEDLDKAGKYENNIDNLGRSGQRTASLDKEAASILQTSKRSLGKGADKKQVEAVKQQESAYKKLKTAITDYDKVNTKANRGTKEGKKLINDAKKSLKESTNEFKKASKQVKTADNTIKKYNKTTGISTEELKGVVDASTKEVDAIKKADTAKKNAEKTQDNYNKKLEEGKKAGQGWTTSFVNGMQGVASAAAGVQMMMGAVDSLTTAIADGSAGFSEYLSAITSIGFALPMFVQGIQSVSKALKLEVAWKKLSVLWTKNATKEEQKNAAAVMAAGIKKIGSKIAEAGANYIAMLTNWPVGTITALALAGAVAAIGIKTVSSINAKKTAAQEEKQQTEDIETAKQSLEAAEGWNEESQAMDDLIAKHKELQEANDKTVEGQKALLEAQKAIIDQVPKLVEKYKEVDEANDNLDLGSDILALEAAAASDDAEQVEKLTNEIDAKIAEATVENVKSGSSAAATRTLNAIAEQTGDDVGDDKTTTWHVGDSNDKEGARRLANKLGIEEKSGGWFGAGAGVDISLDASDPKAFVEQYEKLQEFVQEMEEAGETSDDTYKEVKEGIDAAKESYEELKEIVDSGKEYELQNLLNEMDIDPSTIQSYEAFEEVKDRLIKKAENNKIANEEEVKSFLNGQKVFSTYTALEQKALNATTKYGEQLGDRIKKYGKTLSETELKAFLKVDFDKVQAKTAWDNLTNYYKHLEESEKYKKDATGTANAIKNLKANGTREDYEKLQGSISWGEKGIIEYSQFLNKSYEEQESYLQQLQIQINNFEVSSLQKGLKELYQAYNDAAKEGDEVAKQNIADMIEQHKISIALAQKEAEASRKAQERKTKERKQNIKDLQNEIDIYKELNDAADDLSRVMDNLSSAKEHAYGSEHLALIEGEIKAIEKENELLNNTIWLAETMAKKNKEELSNFGAKFDTNGNISNYNVIKGQYLNRMAKYDKSSDEYKDIEQELKNFETAASKYEENLSKAEEATDQKAENMRKKLDKELEGIEYSVNIKIDVNDTDLKRLQYLAKSFSDPLYDSAKKIKNATQQANRYQGNIQSAETGIDKVLSNAGASQSQINAYKAGDASAISGLNLSSKEIEALSGYTDTILENQESLEDLNETVRNSLMETFNAWQEKMESVGARFDTLGGIVGNFQNIIDTVGEGILGITEKQREEMEKLTLDAANGRMATNKAKMEFTQKSLNTVSNTVADLEKSGKQTAKDSEGNEQTLEWWKKQQAILNDQLLTDQEAFTSSWADALQTAADIFQAQMDRAFDNMDDKLAGTYKSLDELQASFDQDQDILDRYLDGGEKLYELSKLNRKIQVDIDKTSNTKAQKELAQLQQIITEYQRDGVNMSKYELEALQKKYDLKVAEIALEEAQNAKSQVRLQRDSQGNFNYVYTADENKTADTQQKYEDALEANRQLVENQSIELTQAIIKNRQDMIAALREINASDYATTEEYLAAISEKQEFYNQKEIYLRDEYNKAIGRSQLIYAQDFASYEGWSGKKIETTVLLRETLGNEETIMGQNTYGFVENYGKHMEAMVGKMEMPEIAAKDLVEALGDGVTEGGTGYYNTSLANTAAWVTGLGRSMQTAAGSFSLIIGDSTTGTGINGVIASLGDGTATGRYKDMTDNLTTFIGTVDNEGSWTGKLSSAGGKFDLINVGATTLLDNLVNGDWEQGTGSLNKIVIAGNTFKEELNKKIGGIDLAQVSSKATGLESALGAWDKEETSLGNIYTAVNNWESNIGGVMENAGTDVEDFSKDVSKWLFGEGGSYDKPTGGVAKDLSDSSEDLNDYKNDANEAFGLNAAEQASWDHTQKEIEENKDKIDDLYTSLRDLKDDYTGTKAPDIDIDILIPKHQDLKDLIAELEELENKTVNVNVNYNTNGGNENVSYNPAGNKVTATKQISGVTYAQIDGNNWYSVKGAISNYQAGKTGYSAQFKDNASDFIIFNDEISQLERASEYIGTEVEIVENNPFTVYKNYDQSKGGPYNEVSYTAPFGNDPNVKISDIRVHQGQVYFKVNATRGAKLPATNIWVPAGVLDVWGENKRLGNLLSSYDTGGYTGEWGSEGRMAMLHQKEIVLNAHDTENFLTAINIVRSISDRLEQQANMMGIGLNGLFAQFNPIATNNEQLEQQVHIVAEFPNATNHSEIEEAFNNLINSAAQYANRK